MNINIPRVGVGTIIIKDNRILIGKRKNTHGEGSWCFPGGHLEFKESWEDCAYRETIEETGVHIKNIRLGSVTNDIFNIEEKHYITIFMLADYDYGEVELKEPDKCEKWIWCDWNKLPHPLFTPIQNLLKSDYDPFK